MLTKNNITSLLLQGVTQMKIVSNTIMLSQNNTYIDKYVALHTVYLH